MTKAPLETKKRFRKHKERSKSITWAFRVYPDFAEKMAELGKKEDKTALEMLIKLACEKLGLNYLDYR